MIFSEKPVPTPHQVRGKLFRDHAPVPLKTWVFTATRNVISTDVAAVAGPGTL